MDLCTSPVVFQAVGVAYVRTVKTSSGATAVQIVWKYHRGSRQIEHIGSAHDQAEAEPLALEVVDTPMGWLLDGIGCAFRRLGLDAASGGDRVFEELVTARIIEPASKKDAGRVLEEAGLRPVSYRTVKRRLPGYATAQFRGRLSGACAARAPLGPSALVLYDVTTLWFETDTGDGFREPGFSKERRLEPQITVGLLTDATGAPSMIEGFEGNKAETRTILPVVRGFVEAHGIVDVTVVAGAGMLSEANLKDIEDTGWKFIVGGRLPDIPYAIDKWMTANPDTQPADGTILSQAVLMGTKTDTRRRTIYYQYRADRARRALHSIDTQITKTEKAVAGQAPIKRNRFITMTGGSKTVNRHPNHHRRTTPTRQRTNNPHQTRPKQCALQWPSQVPRGIEFHVRQQADVATYVDSGATVFGSVPGSKRRLSSGVMLLCGVKRRWAMRGSGGRECRLGVCRVRCRRCGLARCSRLWRRW